MNTIAIVVSLFALLLALFIYVKQGNNAIFTDSVERLRKDLTINLHHIMDFSTVEGFSAFIINTGKMTESYEAYLEEAIKIPLEDF